MYDELKSHGENRILAKMDAPKWSNVVSSKWVFKWKTNVTGQVIKANARRVSRGFGQSYNVEFDTTFAPTPLYSSVSKPVSIANGHGQQMSQWKPAGLVRVLTSMEGVQASFHVLRLFAAVLTSVILRNVPPNITNSPMEDFDRFLEWGHASITTGPGASAAELPSLDKVCEIHLPIHNSRCWRKTQ